MGAPKPSSLDGYTQQIHGDIVVHTKNGVLDGEAIFEASLWAGETPREARDTVVKFNNNAGYVVRVCALARFRRRTLDSLHIGVLSVTRSS